MIVTANKGISESLTDLAEQLLGCPIYLLRASENVPADLIPPGALGCTSPTFDLACKDWLEGQDRWIGRRPAVYIDDRELLALADDHDGADHDALFGEFVTSVLIHELGHVAESEADDAPPTIEAQELAAALVAFSIAASDGGATISPGLPAWFGHSAQWVRACLHLAHRSEQLGQPVRLDLLFDPTDYAIPAPAIWAVALADEPERLAGESIFALPSIAPPALFAGLWRQTVTNWACAPCRELTPVIQAVTSAAMSLFAKEPAI